MTLSRRRYGKLAKRLRRADAGQAEAAAAELGLSGDPEALEILAEAIDQERRPSVLRSIVDALIGLGGEPAVQALADLATRVPAKHPHAELAMSGLTRLSMDRVVALLGSRAAEEALILCLDDGLAAGRIVAHAAENADEMRSFLRMAARRRPAAFRRRIAPLLAGGSDSEAAVRAVILVAQGDSLDEIRAVPYPEAREALKVGLEWLASDWWTKGQIALMIAAHETNPTSSLQSALRVTLDEYAEKLKGSLDGMRPPLSAASEFTRKTEATCCAEHDSRFGHPERAVAVPRLPSVPSFLTRDFGDYARLIAEGDISELASIPSRVAGNLLHHALGWTDTVKTEHADGGEVPYDGFHSRGGIELRVTTHASYHGARETARKALAARGNPDYDLEAFKVGDWWRLPPAA